jgi:hypothetical protein
VKKEKFGEIWRNSELFRSLRDFVKYKGRCGECEYLNVCGGCRARADAILGDYLEEEPFLQLRAAQDPPARGRRRPRVDPPFGRPPRVPVLPALISPAAPRTA